jgi:NADH/NAD ratio-sensing transcriptional regulator Rex
VNGVGNPGKRISGVRVACVFTVRIVSMLEVEQSVGRQVEAVPLEQMQELATVVTSSPDARSCASFAAAALIPVVSPAVVALCEPYATPALAAFDTSTDA